jgi:hypothetical protein
MTWVEYDGEGISPEGWAALIRPILGKQVVGFEFGEDAYGGESVTLRFGNNKTLSFSAQDGPTLSANYPGQYETLMGQRFKKLRFVYKVTEDNGSTVVLEAEDPKAVVPKLKVRRSSLLMSVPIGPPGVWKRVQ